MDVAWMRRTSREARLAHSFAQIDLDAGYVAIEPLGRCGRFSVAQLVAVPDDYPDLCRACHHAMRSAVERVP
ncbi:hypothetical protein JOF56_005746 [Kibdelosporangium banguiense]|uniref:Zinc-finger n=1 Tax=Kibdelosporangium banguiense TaxID=1365924 RepID=A0ABS4TN93_9PSEU|nr:hypothetical protein [Kibdelosporangium banguiense]MBP2325361.1 hypothetical protein [Kibdelosporangium banguiense]